LKYLINKLLRKLLRMANAVDWSDKLITEEQVKYVIGLSNLYDKIKNVPGHIIELGVGRGRNAIILGQLINFYNQESFRHYFGFDTFAGYPSHVLKYNRDFKRDSHKNTSIEFVNEVMNINNVDNTCTLTQGDILNILPNFVTNGQKHFRAGKLKIALLYIDCNDYLTAKSALEALYPFFSQGALIAIDECRQGGETEALLEFCEEKKIKYVAGDVGGVISVYAINQVA